jgi:hypothetical protein
MLSRNVVGIAHIYVRLANVFAESRNILNNNLTMLLVALCLKYSVLTFYHPGNILFQSTLTNSEGLLLPDVRSPCHISVMALSPHKFTHPSPCCK